MAERNSFVVYNEWYEHISELTNADAGRLFKAMFAYVIDGEKQELGGAVGMAFKFIARQIERDGDKYKKICERNAENGRKGGRPRKPTETEGFSEKPKKPDNDNDNDDENENENDNGYDTEDVDETEHSVLSETERSELVRLSDVLSVDNYLNKLSSWEKKTGKKVGSPFLTVKRWIEQDAASKPKQNNSSFDPDEWERYALNFDPFKHSPLPGSRQ